MRFINDGDTGGNLWASIYVFDDSQELQECCSCEVTPDGLLSEVGEDRTHGQYPDRQVDHRVASSRSFRLRPSW